tara:strand:- start:278 stop:496 length:219 start_codon:yes stop_codon:yes gene_type:complete
VDSSKAKIMAVLGDYFSRLEYLGWGTWQQNAPTQSIINQTLQHFLEEQKFYSSSVRPGKKKKEKKGKMYAVY